MCRGRSSVGCCGRGSDPHCTFWDTGFRVPVVNLAEGELKEANSTPAGPRMARDAKQSAERLLGDDGQNLDGGWTPRNVIDCFDFPRIGAWSGHRCVLHGHPQCLLSRSASELPVGAPPGLSSSSSMRANERCT